METVTALLGPVLTQQGIDNGVMQEDRGALYKAVALFGIVIVVNGLTSFWRQRWNGRLGENIMYDVRLELFSHYQRMGLDWYTSGKSGVLLSRNLRCRGLDPAGQRGLRQFGDSSFTVLVTIILFSYNPLLAILLLAPFYRLNPHDLWFRASASGYSGWNRTWF